jgi:uncharacterized protein
MLEESRHKHSFKKEHEPLRIRAHHLCCIQGFQGYGYSPAFVANMKAVASELKASPSKPLKLISKCDDICISCPSERECSTQKSILSRKIKNMDLAVMKKMEIEEGTVMRADEAFELLNSKISSVSHLEDICGPCKWRQKCLWYKQNIE